MPSECNFIWELQLNPTILGKFEEKALKRKFFYRMLMTLSDQIASFSVEVSDENISGCKSCILCRFCILFLQTFFDDDTRRGYFLSLEHLLP